MTFAFFQSSGAFFYCYKLSKIIESALTRTSTRSLSNHGSVLSGPMDSFISSLFSNLILLHQGYVFLAPGFPTSLRHLGLLRTSLTSIGQGEQDIEYLFHLLCYQVPCLIQQRDSIIPSIIICLMLVSKLCLWVRLQRLRVVRGEKGTKAFRVGRRNNADLSKGKKTNKITWRVIEVAKGGQNIKNERPNSWLFQAANKVGRKHMKSKFL